MTFSDLEQNCYESGLSNFIRSLGSSVTLLIHTELEASSEIPRCFLFKLLSRQMTFTAYTASGPKFGFCDYPCSMYSITLVYYSECGFALVHRPSIVSPTNLISMLSDFFSFK